MNSGSWWWTGRPGVLRFIGLQRVGHDWATELNWSELMGLLRPAALRKVLWQVLEINSKHNRLSRNQFQRLIFLIPFKERKKEPKQPQDKMLRILNHYRSDADQNDNKGSNPIWQNGHPNCLQQYMEGKAGRRWNPPSCCLRTDAGNSPLKGQPAQARTEQSRELKLEF